EIPSVLEFPHQARRIESIPRLPELQRHEAADERVIEWPRREYAQVIDVARLVPLITGTDFFRKDLGKCKAENFGRHERQQLEITLLDLRQAYRRQRRRLSPADLQLDLAHAARIPVMGIGRIDAPRQAVLRLVVAAVGNGELDAVKRLLEPLHHFEDDILVIVLLDPGKIEIGRKSSLTADEHFPQAGTALECQPV